METVVSGSATVVPHTHVEPRQSKFYRQVVLLPFTELNVSLYHVSETETAFFGSSSRLQSPGVKLGNPEYETEVLITRLRNLISLESSKQLNGRGLFSTVKMSETKG